ncbi:ATP-binding protein [Candidatus Leptofilum sp.]|uniref:ATP-binding protein n=1 Tax=Candidatus Leptofilum sp. TaxID=3241576 RepID=UPI003B5BA4D0
MSKMLTLINYLLDAPSEDPDIERRARLLNTLLLGAFLIPAFVIISLFVIGEGSSDERLAIWVSLAVLLGVACIYVINRQGWVKIAAWMFLVLLTLGISFGDVPEEVVNGRTLFMMTIPVLISSIILQPYTSFIVATLVNLLLLLISIRIDLIPNVVSYVALFFIALISWLASRSLEQALAKARRSNRELAKRSAELVKAQDSLVRQERLAALGQLAGGVAHELRNPLGSIKNGLYFLNMKIEAPEPRVKETLKIIETDITRTEAIITSLLDFSRPKQIVVREVVLKDIIYETFTHVPIPNNIALIIKLDEKLPNVFVDPDQMRQVFINLFTNAVQAMSNGGQLTIESKKVTPDKVQVSITDTGGGIDDGNLAKLFEPLFTTRAKGIGLGLAITKLLVERHQGSIEIQTKKGVGSTFFITFPIQQQREIVGDNAR